MKKTFKFLSYIALAAIFSVALSGCGKQTAVDPNANKVYVWGFEDEDAWKLIAKSFTQANKGYIMVYTKQTFDSNYENRTLNSMLSGNGPDVWEMPNDWVYRHKEKLVPMPDTLKKTTNMDNQFVPAIKQSVVFDNNIYALSPSAEPLMLYYNPKIFSQALQNYDDANSKDKEALKRADALLSQPATLWSDLTEAAKLITKKNGGNIELSGLAMGTSNITNAEDLLYLLMLQNGTDILSGDYKLATFNLPKDTATGGSDTPGKRALDFYTSFSDPASPNYSWNDSLGNDVDAFGNGKAAMIFGYSNLQNTLLQKYPNLQYRRAYMPQLQADSSKITDLARFNAFGVSVLSQKPTQSWNLVNLLSTQDADSFNSFSRTYTSQKASQYDTSLTQRQGSNPEKLELATAKSVIKGRYPEEIDQIILKTIAAVNTKTQDSQSALDLAANNATDLLRKESW